jgi:hypothetical protein
MLLTRADLMTPATPAQSDTSARGRGVFHRFVTVTEEDIANGHRGSAKQCPIARALRRELSDYKELREIACTPDMGVSVAARGTVLNLPMCFPPDLIEFIRKFDSGEPVAPFTFEFLLKVIC